MIDLENDEKPSYSTLRNISRHSFLKMLNDDKLGAILEILKEIPMYKLSFIGNRK
jgi:hypothetical protein